MRLRPLARLAPLTVVLALLSTGCGALDSPEPTWVADDASVAERQVADDLAAARGRLSSLLQRVGSVDPERADCIIDGLVDARSDDAVLQIGDTETVSTSLQAPIAASVISCGAAEDLIERWIPELVVELRREAGPQSCVAEAARPWVADRFAEIVADGGLAEDEDVVDAAWLARRVDACDAGAAMMAAAAMLHPQVGADARTPSRWLCAAAAAPAGIFDPLLDPAVTGDDAQAERLESRIAPFFADCA